MRAAGELVDRGGGLRGGHRGARVDRQDAGAELDALGARCVRGQDDQRVAPRDVGRVDGLVAERLGTLDALERGFERAAR